jgi:hypothetical protein
MKILITESQMKVLLNEISLNDISDKIKQTLEKSSNTVKKLKDNLVEIFEGTKIDIENHFKFLLTWGAGIGGFIEPVEKYINNEFPDLSEKQVTLILIAVISTLFFESQKISKRNKTIKTEELDAQKEISNMISELKIESEYEKTLEKSKKLKETFKNFIESVGGTTVGMLNMLTYAFILPLIIQIYDFVKSGVEIDSENFIKRILTFVTLSGATKIIEKILKGIINRFKS